MNVKNIKKCVLKTTLSLREENQTYRKREKKREKKRVKKEFLFLHGVR